MSFIHTIYQAVFRRTSTFALAVVGATFFFERAVDQTGEGVFEYINRGVRLRDFTNECLVIS